MTDNKKKTSPARRLWSLIPWLALLFIIILTFLLLAKIADKKAILAQQHTKKKVTVNPLNVVTQTIVPTKMTDKINLPAEIKPWQDLMVKAEVNSTIRQLFIKEGDYVKEGETLAVLDDRDYSNTLKAIEAKYQLAKSQFDRMDKLRNKDAIAKYQFDQAEALLQELEASVADARLKFERCTIKSPISGTVNELPATKGMLLAYGDPVVQIIDLNKLKVDIAVPESDIADISEIRDATVTFPALGDKQIVGKKHFIASQPTTSAMTYCLQLTIDNPPSEILPGMFARVNVTKQTFTEAIGIPLYAVLNQDGQKYVYKIKDNRAVHQPVETGFIQGWMVQITRGLEKGDQVVIVGHRGLADGQEVAIIKSVTDPGELSP